MNQFRKIGSWHVVGGFMIVTQVGAVVWLILTEHVKYVIVLEKGGYDE